MTNKNILIIGSSGGIGKAFIDIFAKQNANNKIIGLSRSENKDNDNLHSHHFLMNHLLKIKYENLHIPLVIFFYFFIKKTSKHLEKHETKT